MILQEVCELVRVLLGDLPGRTWPDDVLLPLVNSSYRHVQRQLAMNGIPVLIDYAEEDLAAFAKTFSGANLPDDLVFPHRLWEKDQRTTGRYVPMKRVSGGLPDVDSVPRLGVWEWAGNQLRFLGSNQAKTVRIRYEKRLPLLGYRSPDNFIEVRDGGDAIAAGTAMLAPGKRKEFTPLFRSHLNDLIADYIRNEQRVSRRRQPYGYRDYLRRALRG